MQHDKWAGWVLQRGHSSDAKQLHKKLEYLMPVRDRVLDRADLNPDDVLLDVGTGDGLIAFGALERLGDRGRVVFSDVSKDLLDHCRNTVRELGYAARAEFIQASAEDLGPIADESVDIVTTRSVLIYVDDKTQAFREFYRVLRPGGRVSIFEPINNCFPDSSDDFWGFDAAPVRDLVDKLWGRGVGSLDHAADPMLNFNDRDLVVNAEAAGFRGVHLQLDVEVRPGSWVVDWERLLALAPNPNAPTTRELIEEALTPEEQHRFASYMQPLVDSGDGVIRSASAYLVAKKAEE